MYVAALALPVWIIASGNANATQAARNLSYSSLIDRLIDPVQFTAESRMLSNLNPSLTQSLRSFTYNSYFVGLNAAARAARIEASFFTYELMIGWLVRNYNVHLYVFPIVVLSLWALRSHVPAPFWQVLQKLAQRCLNR